MKLLPIRILVWTALSAVALSSCSRPDTPVESSPPPEENLRPSDLTGTALTPDTPSGFQVKALYVHGGPLWTHQGSGPSALPVQQTLDAGDAVSTPASAEAELYLQTNAFTDGVVRIGDKSWVVIEQDARPDRPEMRVFVYGGKTSFFLPPGHQDLIAVWTPAGTLISRGGIFHVTVSPSGQVLVASREGEVVLEGRMLAAATPGRALSLNRPGSWTYAVPPGDVSQLQDRWETVMTEESPATLAQQLPDRLERLSSFLKAPGSLAAFFEPEATELVVWAWQAQSLLPTDPRFPSADALLALWRQASQLRAQRKGVSWPGPTSLSPPALLGLNP